MICNAEYMMGNPIPLVFNTQICLNPPLNHGFCGVLNIMGMGLYWKYHRSIACESPHSAHHLHGRHLHRRFIPGKGHQCDQVWLKFWGASEASFVVGLPSWLPSWGKYEPDSPPGPPPAPAIMDARGRIFGASGRSPRTATRTAAWVATKLPSKEKDTKHHWGLSVQGLLEEICLWKWPNGL